ncbi:MAG: DNA translocase FtsK 4TM domain-containing protein [bacterium]
MGRNNNSKKGYFSHYREPLKSEVKKGIVTVFIFVLALVSLLSFFDQSGQAGRYLLRLLYIFFGKGAAIAPVLLLITGLLVLLKEKLQILWVYWLGLILFALTFFGLFHLWIPPENALTEALAGHGGGLVGLILSYPLGRFFGFWASLIIFLALLITSVLILLNLSLAKLFQGVSFFKFIFNKVNQLVFGLTNKIFDFVGKRKKPQESLNYEEAAFESKDIKELEEEVAEEKKEQQLSFEDIKSPKAKRSSKKIDLPLSLLESRDSQPTSGDINANTNIIKRTLENFGIEVEMGKVSVGPTVTQYTLKPADGVKLSQIVTLHNDLALALAAHPIRIEAPIPGKSLVGIEVPNQSVAVVRLKEILDSDRFRRRQSNLMISLGKDVAGEVWLANLRKMPHLLIAGATGSGKTIAINSIIVSLIFQNSPDDLKFILIDPKRVELPVYNSIPYLITPVITDVKKTVNALKWAVAEMERRFEVLAKFVKRDIQSYNASTEQKIPYIVIVIDELADLMATAGPEIEALIIRLAQMSRAVGIHLVLATQRPSVNVITGLIKANITSRIAFAVASLVDSRTILDTGGAEKLLGRGDMLFISSEISKPKRIQGAYVSDKEIKGIVSYLKEKGEPEYLPEVVEKTKEGSLLYNFSGSDDELLEEAKRVVVQAGKASASLLQRRLRIGYARAARLLDLLEEQGVVGPLDGARPREVLIPREDLAKIGESDEEEGFPEEEEEEIK